MSIKFEKNGVTLTEKGFLKAIEDRMDILLELCDPQDRLKILLNKTCPFCKDKPCLKPHCPYTEKK